MKFLFSKFLVFTLVISITACSSTKQVVIDTMEPAPIDLAKEIRKIGVVNASREVKDVIQQGGLDYLVDAQDKWLNEKGKTAALEGLVEELQSDPSFKSVALLEDVSNTMLDFHSIDNTIDWNKIQAICLENEVDVIFALSYYNLETEVKLKKTTMQELNLMRDKVEVEAQEITLATLIKNGWRIYDPKSELVLDEFVFDDEIVASAKGVNPVDALRAVENRKDSIQIGKHKGGNRTLDDSN